MEPTTRPQKISRALGYKTTRIDLASPLRREECIRRLQEKTDSNWTIFGFRAVIGHIGERSFSLRKRIFYANSFQTIVRGTFIEESRQTRLHCRFGLHPFVAGFMIFWFSGVTLFGGTILLTTISALIAGSALNAHSLAGIGIPLLMLVFGFGLVSLGRSFARDEQTYLVEFLIKTLDAREVPVSGEYPLR